MRLAIGWICLGFVLLGCSSTAGSPCAPAASAEAAPDGELAKLSDEQLARKMLEVTGGADLGKQVLDAMAENFKKLPGLPPGFMDRFKENAQPEQLTEIIVPIYLKNYDRETMIAAIQFYQSEHGRILVARLPQVTAESMEAGQNWGRALADKTLREMGITPPKRND